VGAIDRNAPGRRRFLTLDAVPEFRLGPLNRSPIPRGRDTVPRPAFAAQKPSSGDASEVI
jgi:hypothetical protein